MTTSLRHRGPDDGGTWVDAAAGVALGHRRLSIVDLSEAGHQPMSSRSGDIVVVYNGEVYNHNDTRRELEALGAAFRGSSDTEVIVEAYAHWDVRDVLPRLNGMFAIAAWNRRARELTLVRDRMGIKPVYWAQFAGTLIFGSELKSLCAHRGWTPRVRRQAVATFMRHGYIPGPHTIYEGVYKLPPGSLLRFRPDRDREPQITQYWSLDDVAHAGLAARSTATDSELAQELDSLLTDAVGRRMIADVPLGAFLSGGVDSSTVAALMQTQSSRPVKTYCIGFDVGAYNEAPHAKAVANHLGTEHTEMYVSPNDALATIPELPRWYDEPFADQSQIPTLLLSRLTRQHVTVALSGDGGDELFIGYPRYFWNLRLQGRIERIPAPVRKLTSAGLQMLTRSMRTDWMERMPRRLGNVLTRSRLQKLGVALDTTDPDAIYREVISIWDRPSELVRSPTEVSDRIWNPSLTKGISSIAERMQLIDMATYLPDNILTKVDRASMAVALEARVPLIDYRVVEWAWRLPLHAKLRDGRGKWILRQVLRRYVPDRLIERPKMGFGIPLGEWLRGPLRDWGEELLEERRLNQDDLLDPTMVRRTWQGHVSGQRDCASQLWPILMLQSWLRMWM
jgi:asparagine synthase (glutamine-hydrolysing)